MQRARLTIDDQGYRLSRSDGDAWVELAALPARGLMPGSGLIDEPALEAAIEHAEDWLMPHAAALSGADLDVVDATGRLASGLKEVFASESARWDTEQLESLFLELGYMVARPRLASKLEGQRDFVADIVLLRELSHHAKLQRVTLRDCTAL